MKKIIKQINQIFVMILLFFFYFVFIGLAFIIYKIFNKTKKQKDSFWEDVDNSKLTRDYFSSAY